MDRRGSEAAVHQLVGHLGRGPLGAGEDDRAPAALGLQDARDHLDLVHGVRAVGELLHGRDGLTVVRPVVAHRPDVRGLSHVAAGQRDHGPRHGGAEEHRVPARRRQGEQLLHVRQEAQVEHLVGLVQHDSSGVAEVEVSLGGQVEQPARGADDDLDALLQRLDLRLVGAPAVDRQHADPPSVAGLGEVAGDLDGQLARGGHHEGLRGAATREVGRARVAGGEHVVQDRQAEPEGLARPRLGLADDVVPGERHGQGHRLDGEGVDDPAVGQRADDVGVDAEVGEGAVVLQGSLPIGGCGPATGVCRGRVVRSRSGLSLGVGRRARREQPCQARPTGHRSNGTSVADRDAGRRPSEEGRRAPRAVPRWGGQVRPEVVVVSDPRGCGWCRDR